MQERYLWIDTPDGQMETFICAPDGKGPFPGVVMYQNVGGFSEALHDMARHAARGGYYVAVPDLYYRLGRIIIDPDNEDPDSVSVRSAVTATMRNARVMSDTRALLDFMAKDPLVKPGPKGSIGYCMGGRYAVCAAGTFPDEFRATASLYGTRLITDRDDSPHLLVKQIKGEVYLGFAEHDRQIPPEIADKFTAMFRDANVNARVETHPGTRHGYAFPTRNTYQKQAADLSWQRIFEMFEHQLRH